MVAPTSPTPNGGKPGLDMTQKATLLVLSLLAAAFLGWASVVWQAWQDTREMLYGIGARQERTQASIEAVARDMRRLAHDLERHEDRPWHDAAGNSLSTMRTELDQLKKDSQ